MSRAGRVAIGVLLLLITVGTAAPAWGATYYRVSVSRLAPNLYRDQESGAIVRTRSCYEYAERDSAILRWDGPSSGTNRLIFSSGLMCEVTDLDERRGPLTPDETLAR